MNIIKVLILVCLCLLLSSCGTVDSVLPMYDGEWNNLKTFSSDKFIEGDNNLSYFLDEVNAHQPKLTNREKVYCFIQYVDSMHSTYKLSSNEDITFNEIACAEMRKKFAIPEKELDELSRDWRLQPRFGSYEWTGDKE